MSIKIKIGSKKEERVTTKISNKIRKTINGSLVFSDHEDINIVVIPEKRKVLTLPKEIRDEKIYQTQDRLFSFLLKKGLIEFDSVKSGNVYGSLEGKIQTNASGNSINEIDLTILNISKWIDEERPIFMYEKAFDEEYEDNLVDPDIEDTTGLGEIPTQDKKRHHRLY